MTTHLWQWMADGGGVHFAAAFLSVTALAGAAIGLLLAAMRR